MLNKSYTHTESHQDNFMGLQPAIMESPWDVDSNQVFVQAPEHRPGPGKAVEAGCGIPVIDLAADTDEVVRRVGSACREWGFFEATNHGVAAGARRRVEFFGLAAEEKRRVSHDDTWVFGYHDAEYTFDVRGWKEVFEFGVENPTLVSVAEWWNRWPERPAGFREACEEYTKEVQKLCIRLMELIALSLGLPANRFSGFFKDQTSFIRLNHYPPCPIPDLALGIGPHKDTGALTVLALDDVEGLQVKSKTDGEWYRVKPTRLDAYIVNVGNIMQVWSNEKYESVEHRVVVNSERERLSIPFFLTPSHYTMIEPLEELTDELNPAKYRPINWGKFHETRRGNSFKILNAENIQFHHFRVPD